LPRLAARTSIVALVDARRPVPDLGVPVEAIGAPRGVPRLGWLELGVVSWLARHPGTLMHGAAYGLPLGHHGPGVVTLHDVAWETHPRDFGPWKRRVWQVSARRSAVKAGAVVTVSEFSKQAIVAAYGVDPKTVLVAPCAAGAAFQPNLDRARARPDASGGSGARYVVAMGGARRRNLPLAVEAWHRARVRSLSCADVGLVVVGPEQPPSEPGMSWLGTVDDVTWAAVLAGAEALIYPTSHEGFGMPAAEACACGVPVVCAPVASLPEVLGNAAAWAPSLDADAFATTLITLLEDPVGRADLADASLARAALAPTWEAAADTVVEAYDLARWGGAGAAGQSGRSRGPRGRRGWDGVKPGGPSMWPASGTGDSGTPSRAWVSTGNEQGGASARRQDPSAEGDGEPNRPEVSVVIVNWNAGRALAGCLGSLYEYPPSVPFEVIVVDNASTDSSVEAALWSNPGVRLIANTDNRGLAAANNQGIEAARAGAILISNPDVVFRAGAVDALLATLHGHPRAAFVVPRLSYEDGSLHTSVGDLPTLREALAGRQAQRRSTDRGAHGFWWDGWAHDEERRVGRGHEAAYLVSRRAVEEVGMQDERFFLDWEGIDWTARMADAGWEVWFTPAAEVTHLGGVSIRQVPFRWIVRSHRGIYLYFATRHRRWRPWLGPVLAARAGMKLAAAVVSDVYDRGHRGGG